MKTSEFINLLVEDHHAETGFKRKSNIAVLTGTAISVALLVFMVGVRPRISDVLAEPRVAVKVVATALAAVIGCSFAFRAALPGRSSRNLSTAMVLPASILAAAVLVELTTTPSSSWWEQALGRYPVYCLIFIPSLSAAPLTGLMTVMRMGAPANAAHACALAGLAAGLLGAAVYAWHCTDDSPFFVVIWYGGGCLHRDRGRVPDRKAGIEMVTPSSASAANAAPSTAFHDSIPMLWLGTMRFWSVALSFSRTLLIISLIWGAVFPCLSNADDSMPQPASFEGLAQSALGARDHQHQAPARQDASGDHCQKYVPLQTASVIGRDVAVRFAFALRSDRQVSGRPAEIENRPPILQA